LKIIGGRTLSGSRARIFSRPFATSVAAESSPFAYSNSTETEETSSLLTEETRRTCSIADSSFSIVRVTSASTSSAEAPG
jgi:hypothetical protein